MEMKHFLDRLTLKETAQLIALATKRIFLRVLK